MFSIPEMKKLLGDVDAQLARTEALLQRATVQARGPGGEIAVRGGNKGLSDDLLNPFEDEGDEDEGDEDEGEQEDPDGLLNPFEDEGDEDEGDEDEEEAPANQESPAIQARSSQGDNRVPAPPPPPGAPAPPPPPTGGKARKYRVELKAWIPHARVVDPEEPARLSNWMDTITSLIPDLIVGLEYRYTSHYRGDNHKGYAGSHRAMSVLEFTWDGTSISGVKASGSYGASHRDWTSHAYGTVLGNEFTIDRDSGSESKTASSSTSGSGGGRTFQLGIDSANPLVMTVAPAINSDLTGTFNADGSLTLSYSTDGFPSHGVQVLIDGAAVLTRVINDASGVPGEGVVGAVQIGARLSSQSNNGNINIPATVATG